MHERDERALAAVRTLLRASHLAGPSSLPLLVAEAGERLGAEAARLYLVDYEQSWLVPVHGSGRTGRHAGAHAAGDGAAEVEAGDGGDSTDGTDRPDGRAAADGDGAVAIDGTVPGLVFTDIRQHVSTAGGATTVWSPVLDGTERLGVLSLRLPAGEEADPDLLADVADVAALLAELVLTRSLYGDAVELTRRREDLTVAAELQWGLLPPLTYVAPDVSIAGVLSPAHEVAGDSFDYAANGDVLHVSLLDAMGHGLEATLLAAVALSVLRNSRRSGRGLAETVLAVDSAIAAQFGPDKFLTGIVGELHVPTGVWRWVTCGHPPALLLREGQVVKRLDSVVGVPIGLGLFDGEPEVGQERLQPGDRLLLHTDGVTEARDQEGNFFGDERLQGFLTREAADARPVAETLRRLNLAVLRHQHGRLQDDATTVILEWRTDEAARTTEGAVPAH
ncbi:PP2C family protein-serine/threonine phosphatase [Aquipuribacter hungaricus]|uniref:PP2C family protein-serine/threonine phosphatase n=1 Tax=Aquipuribacter hungaricus TaxID=545624 RepID=A0ABV7WC42_9MICO